MKKPPVTLYSTAAESVALFRRHLAKQATLRVLDTLRRRMAQKKTARA
ncbi:MAG: hypothetical protein KGR46_12585 [Verrucomicrobia bacterium]|nr:hypothetical protein [Verrucomicrobiota bacterium]